jgi:hypothetical protein
MVRHLTPIVCRRDDRSLFAVPRLDIGPNAVVLPLSHAGGGERALRVSLQIMTRKLLAAAVSLAPLAFVAGAASAQVEITTSTTTPVATATASSGSPSGIDISSSGSVGLTVPGVAVTVNSSNVLTNEGEIGATDINGATGVQLVGGNTGSFTNTGTVLITESYAANTDTNDGLLDGVYAQGDNRIGIQVIGPGSFNGGITTTGAVTVHGNGGNGTQSIGVDIEAPITGSFIMQTVSPTTYTSSTTVTVTDGSITTLGDNSIGLYIAPSGGVGGNMQITSISASGGNGSQGAGFTGATGPGAEGAVINGTVGGTINISGAVTSTGYRTTARSTDPTIEALYTAQELQQGGSAVIIGGQVQQGVIISSPPLILSTTTNSDLDSNGVPDSQQTAGSVTTYGSAPAMVIGQSGLNAYLGVVPAGNGETQTAGDGKISAAAGAYGLIVQGSIVGDGVFDPVTTPNVGGPISATGLQIGTGDTTGTYTAVIAGGIWSDGLIEGEAYQASATAIHFTAGGQTPLIDNEGSISAISEQVTTTLGASGYSPVNVYGILIDKGANVASIVNNSSITADIVGSGGAGATEVGAIVDRSGTLTSVTNTGSIVAEATQTVLGQPMPIGATVAIDMSAGTTPQTLLQQTFPNLPTSAAYSQTTTYTVGQYVSYENVVYEALTTVSTAQDPLDYPSLWRPVGALSPSIVGNIYFGSGGATLTVNSGTIVSSVINLGTGQNTINVEGANNGGGGTCTGIACAEVSGAIEEAPANVAGGFTSTAALQAMGSPGGLTINVDNGTLTDLNPNKIYASSVNVGANGQLIVSADPRGGSNTEFLTSGASTFAQGAQLGISLVSIPTTTSQTYVILQTTGSGTLSAGTFATNSVGNAPFLYYANATVVPATTPGGPASIDLTVTQKTPAQLGFNTAEGNALQAVLDAAPQNAAIQSALLTQTTQSGLRSVYDQLLPNQGQGLFDALDAAAQSVSNLTSAPPDNGNRVAGTSLWLQEVNEQVSRSGIDSPGSYSKLVGVVAGWEHLGLAGGAVGMTLGYMNDGEVPTAAQLGSGVVGNLVEASLYYRRSIGGFTVSARGGFGGAFFSSDRLFLASGTTLAARANFDGYFYDGHVAVSYQQKIGHFYVRPELSADYLDMYTEGYSETGGGPGFDLSVGSQNDSRLTGSAILAVGRAWGQQAWFQSELRFGIKEVLEGTVGDTEASFSGGSPFELTPDNDDGGWATVGFSLRAGSPNSYFALEGDADFRNGEQRYDLRIAGRSIF